VVVFHAATLVYLPEPGRQQFAELMADLQRFGYGPKD
jgi:hypothetical protein